MDVSIKKSFIASIKAYAEARSLDGAEIQTSILSIFESDLPFMQKVEELDALMDETPAFDELREIFFDLLMMNFFSADVKKLEEDYLESEEWENIEEQTIDRGTELLNLLLYLRECADEDIEPDLEDFLKEFLLVEDDEFQDEYRIYEPLIANQVLAESSYPEIAKVAEKLDPESELRELFYPIMSYFLESSPIEEDFNDFAQAAPNAPFDLSVYQLITQYGETN
jgi:hypothetical protein